MIYLSKLDSLTSIIGIFLVLITTIIALMTDIFIGPFIFLLVLIPLGLLIIRGGFKILKEVLADIIFGILDTGLMTMFAVIGTIWGVLGAVVGAGVGDALHIGSELVVIHAQNAGQVRAIFRGGAEHHLAGAGLQVRVITRFGVLGPRREDARALNHNVGAKLLPRQLGWVAFGKRSDFLAVHG